MCKISTSPHSERRGLVSDNFHQQLNLLLCTSGDRGVQCPLSCLVSGSVQSLAERLYISETEGKVCVWGGGAVRGPMSVPGNEEEMERPTQPCLPLAQQEAGMCGRQCPLWVWQRVESLLGETKWFGQVGTSVVANTSCSVLQGESLAGRFPPCGNFVVCAWLWGIWWGRVKEKEGPLQVFQSLAGPVGFLSLSPPLPVCPSPHRGHLGGVEHRMGSESVHSTLRTLGLRPSRAPTPPTPGMK